MAIRMSGINSGLDTDSIVQALVSAQSLKVTKVQNQLTKSQWTQEIWKDVNTKLYSLYTKELTKFKTKGNYNAKKVASSDESVVTATGTSSAANGSHTLQVKSLASAQTVTSGKVNATSTSQKLVGDLGLTQDSTITLNNGSKSKVFTVGENSTIADFVKACKDIGLNANYDTKQQRFFISNSASGSKNSFSMTDVQIPIAEKKSEWVSNLDKNIQSMDADSQVEATGYRDTISGLSDTELRQVKDSAELVRTLGTSDMAVLDAAISDSSKYDALSDTQKAIFEDYKYYKNNTDKINAYEMLGYIDVDFEDNIEEYLTAADNAATANTVDNLSKLGLTSFDSDTASGQYGEIGNQMTFVKAEDACIVLDGAELTDTSNNFTVNGLTLDLKNVTNGSDVVKLTTTTDTDSVYKVVKDFVKAYNEILDTMNTYYSADSAKGYEPLTSEEKDAMSDDEVEKWEKKIKDSLLRRDGTLGTLITSMRQSLMTTSVVDGKKYSLSSFGIMTSSDYTEKGKLHIYGDEDDETYSAETNKLKKAIEENPEAVMTTLAEAGQSLYEALKEKMSRTTLSSALTFYNDKQMSNEQSSYKKQISELQNKLTALEDKYYDRFTAMEKALAKSTSQTSALSSMMGGSQ